MPSIAVIHKVNKPMPRIEDFGVTVEAYLQGQAEGIDILEVKRLEAWGIPREYVMELINIVAKVESGTATDEEIVQGILIMSPPIRQLNVAGAPKEPLAGT